MVVGKTQKKWNKSKKGSKKRTTDPFLKKEWYSLTAPGHFAERNFGQTLVMRTTGTKIASEALKGRVYEVNLADLIPTSNQTHRVMRLVAQDVQGKECLCNFYGMDVTSDKVKSLIRKWQSLIECHVEIKTTDGYVVRIFGICFTRRARGMKKELAYAQGSQVHAIRAKMMEIITKQCSGMPMKDLLSQLISQTIEREITQECSKIYPVQNVLLRKVKTVQAPAFEIGHLNDMMNYKAEVGVAVQN